MDFVGLRPIMEEEYQADLRELHRVDTRQSSGGEGDESHLALSKH